MPQSININDKDFERAGKLLELAGIKYSTTQSFKTGKEEMNGFIYIPSIKLWIAKEKKFYNNNWFESKEKLQENGERMITLPEFIEFLKYSKTNLPNVYKEITELRSPWRAEWIDADFKVKNNKLCINSEILDKNTLMEDRQISLEDYLNNNHTSQGLPSKKVKSGNLYYWYPRSDNNSVASFFALSVRADLNCNWGSSYGDSDLGVRAVRHE